VIRVGRREFLAGVGGAAVAGLFGSALAPLSGARDASLERALVNLLSDPPAAAAIGREWLAQAPVEADAARLVEGVAGGRLPEWRALAAGGAPGLRAAVRERHAEDLAAGRVASVRGYLLSQTEVRLCALADLRASA
jgi:hypothetical protein